MKTLRTIGIIIAGIVLLIAVATYFVLQLPQFGQSPEGQDLERIQTSEQYNLEEEKFENLGAVEMTMTFSKIMETLPDFLFPKDDRSPDSLTVLHPDPAEVGQLPKDQAALTWFGHSAFVLELDGKVILLDPMFGPAAAPFSFQVRRFTQELPFEVASLDRIDAVVFSHDHYDHLDYPTIVKIKDKVEHFFVPLGLGSHLKHWGVSEDRITELDWWQNATLDGVELVCTPAQHFSGRGISDGAKTLWSSWVIKTPKRSIFFSGDSGYFDGFKEIGKRYGPFDIAMMECGQYNKNWQAIHMMPEETAQAGVDLAAKAVIPIHWGMFDLSLHSWTDPITRVSKKAEALGLPLITPQIGERFLLESGPTQAWWKGN